MYTYLRMLLRSNTTIASVLLLLFYWLIGLIAPNTLVLTDPVGNQFTQANYYGFFSNYSATFVTIPLFLILLQHNKRYFDNILVCIRINKSINLLTSRLKACIAEVLITLLFLYLLIGIRQIVYKPTELLLMLPTCLECALLQFFGLIGLAFIFFLSSMFFDSAIYGYFTCMGLTVYDFCSSIFRLPPLFIARTVYMEYTKITVLGFITLILYMIIILFSISVGINHILNSKDYLKPVS